MPDTMYSCGLARTDTQMEAYWASSSLMIVRELSASGLSHAKEGLAHAKEGLAHALLRPNVTRCAAVWRDTNFGVHGNDMAQFSLYECANDAQNLDARSPMWQASSLVQ